MHTIKKINHKLTQYIINTVSTDKDLNYKNTVFLAGTGRSGTTWLSNVINYNNEYRYMFEPFNTNKVKSVKRYFNYLQYLKSDDKNIEHYQLVKRVLSGDINNLWISSYNKKINAKKRLIKDIRGNLMLYYMYKNFPEIPIIFVIRHPCAVTYSKMKLNWDTHLDIYLNQEDLLKDYLLPFRPVIEKVENEGSQFEKHIMMWCIENYVPLKQFNENDILFTYYENVCVYPEDEMPRIFNYIDQEFNERIYSKFKTPSQVSRKESAILKREDLINSWRQKVSFDQIERSNEILKMFGLDRLYNDQSIGITEELSGLLSNN
jgi:hypothetical protein